MGDEEELEEKEDQLEECISDRPTVKILSQELAS